MNLEGRIWKSETSRYWLVEVQDLDIVTEGSSRRDAADMLRDAVESLVNREGFRVRVTVDRDGRCRVGSNDDAVLLAFMLQRLRQREGLSVREVARRLGAKSPNAYAQYETGRIAPSIETLSRLLAALNPAFEPILRVA
jgi:DNA-binding XRE family transcriptional regulator